MSWQEASAPVIQTTNTKDRQARNLIMPWILGANREFSKAFRQPSNVFRRFKLPDNYGRNLTRGYGLSEAVEILEAERERVRLLVSPAQVSTRQTDVGAAPR